MEEEERDVQDELQSDEREDRTVDTKIQPESDKNSETETTEYPNAQDHPSVLPTTDHQKFSAAPVQTENILLFDQNGHSLPYQRVVILTEQNGQLYGVTPLTLEGAQMLLPQGVFLEKAKPQATFTSMKDSDSSGTNTSSTVITQNVTDPKIQSKGSSYLFGPPVKALSPGAPNWAFRLRECEKIGDSYRGYCNTEVEMEAILRLHKQQTHTVFGTRQSPSPAKPATRLMWKSQYVPYDGIPFVNAGSRAIVMECQFGPRRKGVQPKNGPETHQNIHYKATCPARIYIKKVRKFPEYKVPMDPTVDKKVVRQEQEKAFFNLKKSLWNDGGVLRYYIQLPTEKAHLYHDVETANLPPLPEQINFAEEQQNGENDTEEEGIDVMQDIQMEDGTYVPSRLHPLVAEKICELVAQGHNQVYTVRKQLRYRFSITFFNYLQKKRIYEHRAIFGYLHHSRKFVECEMFKPDKVPERHNLCYFPTVNDIKNHIHEAQKALQMTAGVTSDTEWKTDPYNLIPDNVTLNPATVDVSSQKGALLEGIDTLSPEAVHLFSSMTSLQPKIFAQLQAIEFQPALFPGESTNQHPSAAPEPLHPTCPAPPQALLLSSSQFLQLNPTTVESKALCDSPALFSTSQLVSVTSVTNTETDGSITRILLEDRQTIPVHIGDTSSITLSPSTNDTQV
ncbi:calcium-responsive transcription factor isoform X2 [Triplophysa dalaica]|uniref:calcium-responsive transcription factor isoform X2 n=1 Tax=Triplophysa dalaica TaxID=1582913 RepID=UPI0024DFCC4F|nr:calcium-responsive transcription factor isoform X2 [Triplophysa dalaica]